MFKLTPLLYDNYLYLENFYESLESFVTYRLTFWIWYDLLHWFISEWMKLFKACPQNNDWPALNNINHHLIKISSVQFSRSVVSDSLQPYESQHARLPCPSPTPGAHSDSCPSSQWCHQAISSSVIPFSSCPQSLPVFSNESTLPMRWPKYWSFSFSIIPSKEHPGLIFRMNWLDLIETD